MSNVNSPLSQFRQYPTFPSFFESIKITTVEQVKHNVVKKSKYMKKSFLIKSVKVIKMCRLIYFLKNKTKLFSDPRSTRSTN